MKAMIALNRNHSETYHVYWVMYIIMNLQVW